MHLKFKMKLQRFKTLFLFINNNYKNIYSIVSDVYKINILSTT